MNPNAYPGGAVLLGLLGCGRVAERFHVPAIGRLRNARLTAAYDPDLDRCRRVARTAPGCRAFESVDALLDAHVVDALVIASAPETRATLAVQALAAGLPVLIEPPIAASMEEAEWIREAERITRLPVMAGFNRRYWEPVERLRRKLVARDDPTVSVETVLVTDANADPLESLAIHLDLARHLLERDPATVGARRDGVQVEARITFHGDRVAQCRVGPGAPPEERIRVHAGGRSYEVRSGSERIRPAAGLGRRVLDLMAWVLRRLLGRRDGLARSYERQLGAFVAAVQSRAVTGPGTADGAAAMLAIETARQSLGSGGTELPVPPVSPA